MARFGSARFDLLLHNCHVATMSASAHEPYGAVRNGAIGIVGGKVSWVGPVEDLGNVEAGLASGIFGAAHDCGGCWVTPGLIDCHTHLVYGGNRSAEWELKLRGATYEEVARAGGGIVNTVDGTRSASVAELVRSALPRVAALQREGVTACEVKSGYGLNEAGERKMLEAARELGRRCGLRVTTTFLGAHAVPREYAGRADAFIDEVVLRILPKLASEGLVDCVDAFCESVGFSVAQTDRVFTKARELGLPVRLHGDQLHDFEGGVLAARHKALSCDHCEYTSQAGVQAMAAAGCVAVLLPTANFFIKEAKKPPVDAFRAAGVPMALATNCNPGSSPCSSILLVLNMACTLFGLSCEEALAGVTRHAAQAMGLEDERGTIEPGKVADLVVWGVTSPCELAYYLGLNPIRTVFVDGVERRCYSGSQSSP